MIYERIEKVQSPLEKTFLEDCAVSGLLVEPQYPVGKIHCDFAVVDKQLAIECDSKEFHSSGEAMKNDQGRDEIYRKHEWAVLRISGRAILKGGENIAQLIKEGRYDNVWKCTIYDCRKEDGNFQLAEDAEGVLPPMPAWCYPNVITENELLQKRKEEESMNYSRGFRGISELIKR